MTRPRRSALGRLRGLDERVVPAGARLLRRFGTASVRVSGLPALRRLDRRFASSGPLGLVREVPQVGFLVVAALFVAASLSAASLYTPRTTARPATDTGPLVLGAAPGQDVGATLAAARSRLVAAAAARPTARYFALVTLSSYRPVNDAEAVAAGLVLERGYLRAPGVDGAQVLEVPVTPQTGPAVLAGACSATAKARTADATDLRNLAATVDPAVPALKQQKDDLIRQAEREEAEAAAYRPPCGTLYALLVEGEAGRLRALLDAPGVRGVEIARAGARLAQLRVQPVLPDVSGIVPSPVPS